MPTSHARPPPVSADGTVGTLLEGDSRIPIVARLRQEERAQLADVANLYVYPQTGIGRVPLNSLAPVIFQMSQERIVRRDHFRTMTVNALTEARGPVFGNHGGRPMPKIDALRSQLPPGYRIVIGGEQYKQEEGFGDWRWYWKFRSR